MMLGLRLSQWKSFHLALIQVLAEYYLTLLKN